MNLRPVNVRRVDWFRVLADLKRVGMSLRVVASLTGVSKSVLIGLRNNEAEPKMVAGESLVTLWSQSTGQDWKDLPRWGDEYKPRTSRVVRTMEEGQVCCPTCGAEHRIRSPKKGPPDSPEQCNSPEQMPLIA